MTDALDQDLSRARIRIMILDSPCRAELCLMFTAVGPSMLGLFSSLGLTLPANYVYNVYAPIQKDSQL